MGYTTEFRGGLLLSHNLTQDQLSKIETEMDSECHWMIQEIEGDQFILWDGNENFYNSLRWLQYIIDTYLMPSGIYLDDIIYYRGQDFEDMGIIYVDEWIAKRNLFVDIF